MQISFSVHNINVVYGHSTSLNSQDDVLGDGPAAKLSGQLDPDHLGALKLPGDVSHHVHGVSAAHTDTETNSPGKV